MKAAWVLWVGCWAALAVIAGAAETVEVDLTQPPDLPARPAWERLLVRVKAGQTPAAAALARSHARRVQACTKLPILMLELEGPARGRDVAAKLKHSGLFDFVEPDFEVSVDATPNDTRYAELWAMPKISAPQAWNFQTSASDVVVAVVDTGVWRNHPDLANNIWVNPANGTPGFKFIGGVMSTNPDDDHGHGTHVAGTIGAIGNNALGVVGVNWNVRLAAFKFLGSSGSGFISDAVLCYDTILQLVQQGVNIRVANNSWGGGGASQAFQTALDAATAAGVLSVFAAGNNGQNIDTAASYPASYTNVLVSVLASSSTDTRASFSNYGYAGTDLAAPGVGILSTAPTGTCALCDSSGYKSLSGTSMAAPHTAGALAALFHLYPQLTPAQAWSVLLNPGSYDALSDAGAAQTSTGGRLNLYKLWTNPYVNNPVPNRTPTVTASVAPDPAAGGEEVQVTFAGSDPDGDALRFAGYRNIFWLANRLLRTMPQQLTGTTAFAAGHLSRPVWLNYVLQANDRKGGTGVGADDLTILEDPTPMMPPAGTLAVTLLDPTQLLYRVSFPMTDPDSAETWFELSAGNSTFCCYQGIVNIIFSQSSTGRLVRVSTLGMDSQLNEVRVSTTAAIGPVIYGQPPRAVVSVDATSGEAPLVAHFDASGATDPDSTNLTLNVFAFSTFDSLASVAMPVVSLAAGSKVGTVTFSQPGSWRLWFLVTDEKGNTDSDFVYIYVTPALSQIEINPVSGGPFALGAVGGPFAPNTQSYAITNSGSEAVVWQAQPTVSWLTLSAAGGDLQPGEADIVAASVNSAANALGLGTHSGNIQFQNLNSGAMLSRPAAVTVQGTVLALTPSGGLVSSGPAGGPFTPAAAVYTVGNAGNIPMTWSASDNATWISVSPAGGTLNPGATAAVTVSINAQAGGLVAGGYVGQATVANLTGGTSATRSVNLSVSAPTDPCPLAPVLALSVSRTVVALSWNDQSCETQTVIERAVKPFKQNSWSAFSVRATVGANVTQFTDTSVTRKENYRYRIRAQDGADVSDYSNTVEATIR